jgi:hypothetical protein
LEYKLIDEINIMKKINLITIILMIVFLLSSKFSISQYQYDISDNLWSIVAPTPLSHDIDMNQCITNHIKDSVVMNFVQNIGSYKFRVDTIYFTGADADAFSVVSGIPVYTLSPGENKATEFRFMPTEVRLYQAGIVIITQADTLYQTIKGYGVEPAISMISNFIDFGQVKVGTEKDTIQVETFKNNSSSPIKINYTRQGKPNDYDFMNLSGGGSFVLNPGETAKFDLRFKPRSIGRTSGTLEVYFDGPGSPIDVQLYGEGIIGNPQIVAEIDSFPVLVCDTIISKSIKISNSGISNLIISELYLTGVNADEFFVSKQLPIEIEPNNFVNIEILFKPVSIGLKNADLIIKSNSKENSTTIINISSRKENIDFTTSYERVDLGFVCPNESKDTTFIIKNDGTLFSEIEIYYPEILELSSDKVYLSPDGDMEINLTLRAQQNEGILSDTIKFKDLICGVERIIIFTVNVVKPKIESQDIVITTYLNQAKDGVIQIKNTGLREIIITNAPQINSPFEIVNTNFPLKIPVGASTEVSVRYTPSSNEGESIVLNFMAEPCDVLLSVNVSTIVNSSGAVLNLPEISAYSGETVELPLILTNMENLRESGVSGFDIILSYNRTLLAPLDYPENKINDNTSELILRNVKLNEGGNLGSVRFIAGLGDAESSELKIVDVQPIGGNSVINTHDGIFHLLGICYEGGTRLLNPEGQAGITSISPNPGDKDIKITLNLIEKSYTKVTICNSLGESCDEYIFEGTVGEKEIDIAIHNYSNGIYYINLQTPTINEVKKIIVIK